MTQPRSSHHQRRLPGPPPKQTQGNRAAPAPQPAGQGGNGVQRGRGRPERRGGTGRAEAAQPRRGSHRQRTPPATGRGCGGALLTLPEPARRRGPPATPAPEKRPRQPELGDGTRPRTHTERSPRQHRSSAAADTARLFGGGPGGGTGPPPTAPPPARCGPAPPRAERWVRTPLRAGQGRVRPGSGGPRGPEGLRGSAAASPLLRIAAPARLVPSQTKGRGIALRVALEY